MQQSTRMVNICIFCFCLAACAYLPGCRVLILLVSRPQHPIQIGLQTGGPLSVLLCIPLIGRSNLIWFKTREKYIGGQKTRRNLCVLMENLEHVSPPALATSCRRRFMSRLVTSGESLHQNTGLSELSCAQPSFADRCDDAGSCAGCS